MNAPTSENGYVDAFYELKEMMDIGARAQSPAEVWRTQMRPRLAALLAKPSVVGGIDRVGLVNERLDNGEGSIVLDPDQNAAGAASGMVKTDLPIGDADHLAAPGAVYLRGDVVEIGAGHGAGVSDAAESAQAIPDDRPCDLRLVLPEHKASCHITHNDHRSSYQTVRQWIEQGCFVDRQDFISPEELERAIEHDELWTVQWYPDTPVGFCIAHASSLEALNSYFRAMR